LQNQVYFSAFNLVLKGFSKNLLISTQISVLKIWLKPSLSLLSDLAHLSGRAHLSAPAYLVEPDQVASARPTGRTPSLALVLFLSLALATASPRRRRAQFR
jgi:hypothetical protein